MSGARSSRRRAASASSILRMNVSCDSRPMATPSRSTFSALSRSASDNRAGYVWNSKDDVTLVIVGQPGRSVQKTGNGRHARAVHAVARGSAVRHAPQSGTFSSAEITFAGPWTGYITVSRRRGTVRAVRGVGTAGRPNDADVRRRHARVGARSGAAGVVVRSGEARDGSRYGFAVDDGPVLPDPRSRRQPDGPDGLSAVVDHGRYAWRAEWGGRPPPGGVLYELHVGTYTPEGTLDAAAERLDHLAGLGVTHVE